MMPQGLSSNSDLHKEVNNSKFNLMQIRSNRLSQLPAESRIQHINTKTSGSGRHYSLWFLKCSCMTTSALQLAWLNAQLMLWKSTENFCHVLSVCVVVYLGPQHMYMDEDLALILYSSYTHLLASKWSSWLQDCYSIWEADCTNEMTEYCIYVLLQLQQMLTCWTTPCKYHSALRHHPTGRMTSPATESYTRSQDRIGILK